MQPPKTDFRFSFYTSKNMHKKNNNNANLLEKYPIVFVLYNYCPASPF